ncbi:NrsF family protein [Pararhizobium haloflavum]|uniref:NrsF family protein n=1 Tax=Pararhizobium haloflavum TaxID=2037914 RepID=UPI000C17B553|nr:NrsF family protein [Pararhizobium haloflavum]
METEKLIAALSQDAALPQRSLVQRQLAAGSIAVVVAFCAFALFVGPRSDIASALETPRFLLKPVLTLLLFAAAFFALARAIRPGSKPGSAQAALLIAPVFLGIAVITEMTIVPSAQWGEKMLGTNAMLCLTVMPALSFGPLMAFLWFLRQGAPTHPARAGAIAGLAAAGLGATFYALHCTDDSPLFVTVWYPMATAIVVTVGSLMGRRLLRW